MEGQIRTPNLAFLIICHPFVTGTRRPSAAPRGRLWHGKWLWIAGVRNDCCGPLTPGYGTSHDDEDIYPGSRVTMTARSATVAPASTTITTEPRALDSETVRERVMHGPARQLGPVRLQRARERKRRKDG